MGEVRGGALGGVGWGGVRGGSKIDIILKSNRKTRVTTWHYLNVSATKF